MLWYLKQLLPLTYWTTCTLPGGGTEPAGKYFTIWRMWFGRCFSVVRIPVAE
ncbi:MAG: hypothetical protein ACYTFQ_17885 [Planctomycetota bacterium]|jgi:hypothetical protein